MTTSGGRLRRKAEGDLFMLQTFVLPMLTNVAMDSGVRGVRAIESAVLSELADSPYTYLLPEIAIRLQRRKP